MYVDAKSVECNEAYESFSAACQCFVHNFLRLAHNRVQVRFIFEALRIDLVNVFRARGSGREPAVGRYDLETTNGRPIAGGTCKLAVIGSPASVAAVTASGESFSSLAFCSGVAGASMRV